MRRALLALYPIHMVWTKFCALKWGYVSEGHFRRFETGVVNFFTPHSHGWDWQLGKSLCTLVNWGNWAPGRDYSFWCTELVTLSWEHSHVTLTLRSYCAAGTCAHLFIKLWQCIDNSTWISAYRLTSTSHMCDIEIQDQPWSCRHAKQLNMGCYGVPRRSP